MRECKYSKKKTCSEDCYRKLLSESLTGKTGGYNYASGNNKYFKGSLYNGIWMDSSWETEFVKRLDFIGVEWTKNYKFVLYEK